MKNHTKPPTYPSIENFAEHLTLGRCAATTKASYLRAIRKLAFYVGHDPATLDEAAVRAFLLYLKKQRYAASTRDRGRATSARPAALPARATLLAVPLVLRPAGPSAPPLHLRCPRCAAFTLQIVGRLPRPPS